MPFDAEQGRRSRLVDLVIPNTTQPSNFISSSEYEKFTHLAFLHIGAIAETVNPQVNNDPAADETADAQWNLYDPITPGTAGFTLVADVLVVIPAPPTHGFRLKSTTNVAAERTIRCWGLIIPS